MPAAIPDPAALAQEAAEVIAAVTGRPRHDAVVVLGSGWAPAAAAFGEPRAEVPVATLPGFHPPAAPGHAGLLRSYGVDGVAVLCLLGRTHLYEGYGVDAVAHPVRTATAAGCRVAVLTNANGSLRADWPLGTGVLIADHLNLAGVSPLCGQQFVDLTNCWSPRLRRRIREVAPELVEGIYAFLPGPAYESPAEARMARYLGADVLGMSTVLEAIAARAAGLELLGLSIVTALELAGSNIDPAEVVSVAEASAARLGGVLRAVVRTATEAS